MLGRGLAGLLDAAQGNANAELAADHPRDLERLVEPADAKPRRAEGRCDEKLRTLEHAHACGKPHRQPVPGGEIGRVLEAMDEAVHGKCIVECRDHRVEVRFVHEAFAAFRQAFLASHADRTIARDRAAQEAVLGEPAEGC